jgi:hypothetical protein
MVRRNIIYDITPQSDGSYLAQLWDADGDYFSAVQPNDDAARTWVRETYLAADADSTRGGMAVAAYIVLAALMTVAGGFVTGFVLAWRWM